MDSRHRQRGFTLVEVSIILLVLTILGTTLLPQMGGFNRQARFVKLQEDLAALCSVAKMMLDSIKFSAFYDDPAGDTWSLQAAFPVGLLVGPGDIPREGIAPNTPAGQGISSGQGWYTDDTIFWPCVEVAPDVGGAGDVPFSCDTITYHLQLNAPHLGFPYPNPVDDPRPVGAVGPYVTPFFGWRGPYFADIKPDPWGNRYMINTFALYGKEGTFTSPVLCYSAGPNGRIDSAFNQPSDSGFVTGADDAGVVLSAGGPF